MAKMLTPNTYNPGFIQTFSTKIQELFKHVFPSTVNFKAIFVEYTFSGYTLSHTKFSATKKNKNKDQQGKGNVHRTWPPTH
jgi:hypothetical protein